VIRKVPNKVGSQKPNDDEVQNLFEDQIVQKTIQKQKDPLHFLEDDQLQEAAGGRSRGEVMEIGIVDAWNNKGVVTPKTADLLGNQKPPIPTDAPEKIVKSLKKGLKKKGKADVLGAETIDVSEEWKTFWPGGKVPSATKTPKTDIRVGPARISLKSGDAAQLMSGGKNESRATFYTAAAKAEGLKKSVFKKVEKSLNNLSEASVAESNLAKAIKQGKDKVVAAADKAHKDLMRDLQKMFNDSPDFKREFAYEAMTGLVKFDNNPGTCDYFLCVDWEGDVVKLKLCTDREYVEHIADQMKLSVRFKSLSEKRKIKGKKVKTGRYRYWSAVGLIIKKLTEEVENAGDEILGLMNEEFDEMEEATFGKVQTFLKDLWDKIKKTVGDYLNRAWNWIKESLRRLMIFLGFVPEMEGWSDEAGAAELNKQIDFLGGNEGTIGEVDLAAHGVNA